jgi:HEAT repeat protein
MVRLARVLGVRSGEERVVLRVAVLFGSIEAARGLGEIGVDTLFISRFGAGFLPWAFMALGATSLVVGLAFGAALGRYRRDVLLPRLLVALAILLLVERVVVIPTDGLVPLAWLTVYAAGAIVVTLAWTVAGSVFDARQAKRLFPLCTSAAIAGSFAGTVGAGPVARLIGTESLVVAQAMLLGAAAAVLHSLAREAGAGGLRAPVRRRSVAVEMGAGLAYVVRSPLMRLVAIAYVLLAALMFSVSFPFLLAFGEAFPQEADLATALGLLSAAVTGTSFVVSLTIAPRLYARFGVATAALVLPLVYLAGFALWIAHFSVVTAAFVRFVQQVTQRGIGNAAWTAFYNVVPAERRGQVLAFNDGVPGQIGTALSGALLLIGGTLLAATQVFWLGAAAAVVCTIVAIGIRRRYGRSLLATLRAGLAEQVLEGGPGLASLRDDPQVTGSLIAGLEDVEPGVRRMALQVLGELRAQSAAGAVAERLADEDAGVRAAALAALAALGASSTVAAPAQVTACLGDADPIVRRAAVRALALDGRRVSDEAGRLAGDPDPGVLAELAVALIGAGEEERPHALLADLLEADQPAARIAGLEAVGRLGGHSPSARLPELLRDPSAAVRAAAVRAVAALDGAGDVTAPLAAALDDEGHAVRRAAADVLRARLVPPSEVFAVLANGSPRAQHAAIWALAGHGAMARAPLLEWASREVARADQLRRQRSGLWAAPGGTAEPASGGEATVAFLADVLARREARIVLRLLDALAVLGVPEAGGLIRRCLRSADPDIRAQAIEAIDSLGDAGLRRAVVALLEDTTVRGPASRHETLDALGDDPDPWIRALALRSRAEAIAGEWRIISERGRADHDPIVRGALESWAGNGGPGMPETGRTIGDIERMLFLRRVPLFAGLEPEDLQRLAATATERLYEPGEQVVREGDLGNELVVIVEGSVRVVRIDDGGGERVLRRYGAGDHFGELAVIRERPRAATVIADTPMRGLLIDGDGVAAILRERPEVAMAMLATLAERLVNQ